MDLSRLGAPLRWSAVALLVLNLPATHPAAAAGTQAAEAVALFKTVCVDHDADPKAVRQWAADRKFAEITNADMRHVYVGDGQDGTGWLAPFGKGYIVLAVRSAPANPCSVFAAQAEPSAISDAFESVTKQLASPGFTWQQMAENDAPSEFGRHIGKVRLFVKEGSAPKMLSMITYEKEGGPYQGTLQLANMASAVRPPAK